MVHNNHSNKFKNCPSFVWDRDNLPKIFINIPTYTPTHAMNTHAPYQDLFCNKLFALAAMLSNISLVELSEVCFTLNTHDFSGNIHRKPSNFPFWSRPPLHVMLIIYVALFIYLFLASIIYPGAEFSFQG